MGYHQNVFLSTSLDWTVREMAIRSALERWPFLRLPGKRNDYPGRVVLALPELTTYLFDNEADYEAALEQRELVESELPAWSREFPDLKFAYIEAECFGGHCEYSGFVCCSGEVLLRAELSEKAHVYLLKAVNFETPGFFASFERGYFSNHREKG
jgi:hypothetical protein